MGILAILLIVIGGIHFAIVIINLICMFFSAEGCMGHIFKASFIAAICFGIPYIGEILLQLVK